MSSNPQNMRETLGWGHGLKNYYINSMQICLIATKQLLPLANTHAPKISNPKFSIKYPYPLVTMACWKIPFQGPGTFHCIFWQQRVDLHLGRHDLAPRLLPQPGLALLAPGVEPVGVAPGCHWEMTKMAGCLEPGTSKYGVIKMDLYEFILIIQLYCGSVTLRVYFP